MSEYDQLKLENQLCFPLYAASRMVTKLYQPLLKELELTYPQYLILLVLWEKDFLSVTDIGKKLILETNTLTPLLKRLESKGVIIRQKSENDVRKVIISLSDSGKEMRQKACLIPLKLVEGFSDSFTITKAQELRDSLNDLIRILI